MNDYTQCITIHDENYNLIKKIDKINDNSLSCMHEIAINHEKKEYVIKQKEIYLQYARCK